MLRGAPPMFVVGVLVPLATLAIRFVLEVMFDRPLYGDSEMTLVYGGQLATHVMLAFGLLELARRTRGRQRIATGIAATTQLVHLALVIGMLVTAMRMRMSIGEPDVDRSWYQLAVDIANYVIPAAAWAMVVALAAAAVGRWVWVGALAIVVTVALWPIPPLRDTVFALFKVAGWPGWLGFMGAQVVLQIALAAHVARRALPPQRDHARAARGFGVAIVAVALRALFAAAMIVWAVAGAGRFVVGALAICALDIVSMAVMIRATWLVAQAQHPELPPFVMHVALAAALATLFGLGNLLLDWFALFSGRDYGIVPPWWIELGGTLALAWTFVALARYATRRARQIAPPVVICAGAFTLFACVGVALRGNEIVTAVCLLLANLAAIPAFRAARRAIAADPIKTTADVFA